MNVQAPAQADARIAQMQELAPGPLGTVGNRRFTPQQGGTVPASRASVFPFDNCSVEDLEFDLGNASGDARAQLVHCIEARVLSRCVGNLLGNLTAPANDEPALTRIAKELEQISGLSQGNLFDSASGEQVLFAYLKAMTYPDLIALCDGVFNHPQAYEAVLDRISPAELRPLAAEMLDQVGNAAFQQLARVVVSEPLDRISEMLNATSVDGEKLAAQLNTLHTGLPTLDAIEIADRFPTVSMLDIYFQSLSKNEFDARMAGLPYQKLRTADNALYKLSNSPEKLQALTVRELLGKLLGREVYARARPGLKLLENSLAQVRVAPHEKRESLAMPILTALVQDYDLFGWAPNEMIEELRELMQQGVDILAGIRCRNLQVEARATA
ncbi:MAG: hypothetical protein ACN6OC_12865 [Alcaligenes sp.]